MRNLTIYVDMDGTIEYLLEPWIKSLNKRFNSNVKVVDIDEWEIARFFPGHTKDEINKEIKEGTIWKEIKPMPDAQVVLKNLLDKGHNIYIVTTTPYQSLEKKMEDLLFKHFPYLNWKNVVITSKKQLLKGDVMIDDGVHNLIGGEYVKILFDATYNRKVDDKKEGLIRVHDWYEIGNIIDKLANENA